MNYDSVLREQARWQIRRIGHADTLRIEILSSDPD